MADYTVDHTHGGMIDVQSDVTHHVDPMDIATASTVTVEIPSPVVTESTVASTLDVKPLSTSAHLDVEPLVADSCVKVAFAPLPETHICQPYRSRLAFTLLGFEVFAWETSGQSEIVVPPRRTTIGAHDTSPSRVHAPAARSARRGGVSVRIG